MSQVVWLLFLLLLLCVLPDPDAIVAIVSSGVEVVLYWCCTWFLLYVFPFCSSSLNCISMTTMTTMTTNLRPIIFHDRVCVCVCVCKLQRFGSAAVACWALASLEMLDDPPGFYILVYIGKTC